MKLLKLLGNLGNQLPDLKEKEWNKIFEFVDFFMTVQLEEKKYNPITHDVKWKKAKEILILLGKIKD